MLSLGPPNCENMLSRWEPCESDPEGEEEENPKEEEAGAEPEEEEEEGGGKEPPGRGEAPAIAGVSMANELGKKLRVAS